MAQPKPRLKFTVNDYMTTPPGRRYQLLNGEMILLEGGTDMAPAPSDKHQSIVVELVAALHKFVTEQRLGQVRVSPYDVVLSEYDVVQPDLLYVSEDRRSIITEANIQGAPDLVVEATVYEMTDAAAAEAWVTSFVQDATDAGPLDVGATGDVSAFTSYGGEFYELQFAAGAIVGDVVCFAPFGTTSTACEEPVRAFAEQWYQELGAP